jgi:thiol:disulfide interchange protein
VAAAPAPPAAPAAASAATPEQVVALFDQFEILGTGGYMSSPEFIAFLHDAENGVKTKGMFDEKGPFAILALVFLGGLALNLTPCVLPMIPINLAIIGAGAGNGRRGRGFLLGLAYGAAMAAVYGVLGLVVILTAGTFGTINASPWFNVGIAALFVVLGLAMFDIVNIDFSRWSSRIHFKQESRGTVLLALGMGAIAALLAGACVAPVVIQVVVFSSDMYAAGTRTALALPFVLGLGMALPWPIAGAGLSALPKPGMWMVRVKQAMGVFIIGMAAYYGYLAYEGFANRWVDPASVSAGVEEKLREGWHASLADGLQTAKQTRSLVLVDFWATWCKNCYVMDRTTLADPSVTAALAGYTKIKFQAETPDTSPARELMQRIRAAGLPAYVVLKPR